MAIYNSLSISVIRNPQNAFRKSISIRMGLASITLALILMLPSAAAYSQSFGKLFTTPEEREYLDGLRKKFLERSKLEGFNISEEAKPWLEEQETQAENLEFEMAGVMNRKNGGKAVWLNGKPVKAEDLPRNVTLVQRNGQYMLRISTETRNHYIKAGQTLNIETGQIRESYEEIPDETENNIVATITSTLLNRSQDSNSTKPEDKASTKPEKVGINDIIEALQTIQETSGVN